MEKTVKDGEIVEEIEETIEETPEEVPAETEEDTSEETKEPEESDSEAEFWQNIEKEEYDDVPAATHAKIKQKLKGRIRERDSEIESLRREIDQLKSGGPKPALDLKRPREDDFDTPEDFEKALDDYEAKRFEKITADNRRAAEARKASESRKIAVDDHYSRAGEFVKKFGIAQEKYQKADESIRSAVEVVLPGRGDVVTDHFISILGDGSEKVLFRIGAKPEVLREFQSLLMEDPTGLKAGIFLGRQMELITNPKKRVSQAPPPSVQLKGDEKTGKGQAKALKKAYDEAHKSGNSQKAYEAKKQARAAGVDTSQW